MVRKVSGSCNDLIIVSKFLSYLRKQVSRIFELKYFFLDSRLCGNDEIEADR